MHRSLQLNIYELAGDKELLKGKIKLDSGDLNENSDRSYALKNIEDTKGKVIGGV